MYVSNWIDDNGLIECLLFDVHPSHIATNVTEPFSPSNPSLVIVVIINETCILNRTATTYAFAKN